MMKRSLLERNDRFVYAAVIAVAAAAESICAMLAFLPCQPENQMKSNKELVGGISSLRSRVHRSNKDNIMRCLL